MFCALLRSRYQVSVYRTNGPLVFSSALKFVFNVMSEKSYKTLDQVCDKNTFSIEIIFF